MTHQKSENFRFGPLQETFAHPCPKPWQIRRCSSFNIKSDNQWSEMDLNCVIKNYSPHSYTEVG